MAFNLFGLAKPHRRIPVAQGITVHIAVQESYNILSIVAFYNFLLNPWTVLAEPYGSGEPRLKTIGKKIRSKVKTFRKKHLTDCKLRVFFKSSVLFTFVF